MSDLQCEIIFRLSCLVKSCWFVESLPAPTWLCICILHFPMSWFSNIQWIQNTDLYFYILTLFEYYGYNNTTIARKSICSNLNPLPNHFQKVCFYIYIVKTVHWFVCDLLHCYSYSNSFNLSLYPFFFPEISRSFRK